MLRGGCQRAITELSAYTDQAEKRGVRAYAHEEGKQPSRATSTLRLTVRSAPLKLFSLYQLP